ncbi:matrix metalloproteinase-2-like [Nelusetta ayraudi]|uniref:matrix metalloproteinase-2-like n=1 Tax=Nelusetta ayraudi TaxID=303726 RepID=UPI003F6E4B1C
MWRVSGAGLVSAGGSSVRRLWRGLPPDLPRIQAVLERESDHAIIFVSGSQFWLFRGLSLQEGYPQPLAALRTGANPARADQEGEQGAAAGRWGLVWDPEGGPVWGSVGGLEVGQQAEDTWTQLLVGGVSGITTDRDGTVCLFKGDQYWKFSFPGSAVQDGYPRSSATDFLDCADFPSTSEELSLSLSPPAGRQEYREHTAGETEREDSGGRSHWGDKGRRKPGATEDGASHGWTRCSCQNGAFHWRTETLVAVSLLLTWTLLFVEHH